MTNISTTNFRDIKLTRETTVDYKKSDNPLLVSIFKQYDTNLDGKFDDKEFAAYEADVKQLEETRSEIAKAKINPKVVSHYEKKLNALSNDFEKLEQEWQQTDFSSIQTLIDYENKHPEIQRSGYKDKSEIPANAVKVDISNWEMGIFDEDKESFTGETYEHGYITGLTDETKNEYLQLLEAANKALKQGRKLDQKGDEIHAKYEQALALKDMAETGYIKNIGSAEFEQEAYNAYLEIRNEKNPFYKELKEVEQKIHELHFQKKDNSVEIEQLEIRQKQLTEASKNWSLKDCPEKVRVGYNSGLNITSSEMFVCSHSTDGDTLTDSHSLQAFFNKRNLDFNLNINGGVTNAQKYDLKKGGFENTWEASLNGEYKCNNWTVSSNSSLSDNKSMFMFRESLEGNYRYKKASFGINGELTHTKGAMSKKGDETGSVTASSSLTTGKFTNTASIAYNPKDGNNYQLNSSANFQIGKVSVNPSLGTSYNDKAKTTTLSPALNASYNLREENGFSLNLNANEMWSTTMKHGMKPQLNHQFAGRADIGYKNISLTGNVNDMDNSYNHSTTYGVEAGFDMKKGGKLSVGYSYQKQEEKMAKKASEDNLVSVSYTLTF